MLAIAKWQLIKTLKCRVSRKMMQAKVVYLSPEVYHTPWTSPATVCLLQKFKVESGLLGAGGALTRGSQPASSKTARRCQGCRRAQSNTTAATISWGLGTDPGPGSWAWPWFILREIRVLWLGGLGSHTDALGRAFPEGHSTNRPSWRKYWKIPRWPSVRQKEVVGSPTPASWSAQEWTLLGHTWWQSWDLSQGLLRPDQEHLPLTFHQRPTNVTQQSLGNRGLVLVLLWVLCDRSGPPQSALMVAWGSHLKMAEEKSMKRQSRHKAS
jgi:hypothetical protein